MFSRAYHRLLVFPRFYHMLLVFLRRFPIGYMFSSACYQLNVFPRFLLDCEIIVVHHSRNYVNYMREAQWPGFQPWLGSCCVLDSLLSQVRFVSVLQVFYHFPSKKPDDKKRHGRPRRPHDSKRCQACSEGHCSK